MRLKRVHIRNFRSIRDATVEFSAQTAILGGNGAGKSTILRAIDRFYSPSANVELDDFFGRLPHEPIEIALTFVDFTDAEHDMFASRIHGGEMVVVRVFEAGGSKSNGRYFGMSLQHSGFADLRATGGASARRDLYKALRGQGGDYAEFLPTVSRADDIPEALAGWEARFPEQCELIRDDGQFFGFANVANGKLQKATSFVFIPAIRDVSADAVDAKGAVIARLMELVVRSSILKRREIREWQARASSEYRELTNPSRLHELGDLSAELTRTLQVFYGEAGVALRWKPADELDIPLPSADVFLSDDGFEGPVDRKGHGLQRAFVLTLLQHLAKAIATDTSVEAGTPEDRASDMADGMEANGETPHEGVAVPMPGLILAIEEPELYQHPTKQRHFAKVLAQLADGTLPGVAGRMQIMFASHSSLFVSMDRFDEVRLARRVHVEGGAHKECRLTSSTLEAVAARLERAHGRSPGTFTGDSVRARLHIIDPEIAEGLFADAVVLVEGASDRAAIHAAAALNDIDLEARGIAVLPVAGKTNLDRPAAIFLELCVPTYLVWDCDKKGDKVDRAGTNRALQLLMGVEKADAVDAASVVSSNFTCFEGDLETTLRQEMGSDLFNTQLDLVKARYGVEGRDEAQKAPFIMAEVLSRAAEAGGRSRTLDAMVQSIVALGEAWISE
jgi:putative ATP-dependent endonuclease of the OLD family